MYIVVIINVKLLLVLGGKYGRKFNNPHVHDDETK